MEQAIGHLTRALKIDPAYAKAAAIFAETESEPDGPDVS
jgi:hypothetical protein